MAEEPPRPHKRRIRCQLVQEEPNNGPAMTDIHPSISPLHSSHREEHMYKDNILDIPSHLLMICEWPINCPRFMDGLRMAGLHCVSQLRCISMDRHLLTALVERWSPQTNTFHLAVGEMTITLQDVALILGIHIDGPPLVGHTIVGPSKRWKSWPDCCDDLLGSHPCTDNVYYDPFDNQVSAKFRMGKAHAKTFMPLRWLRWTFWRDSYIYLTEVDFLRHIRAYILFLLGCYLLPSTSSSGIHLQYLPLLEDIGLFSTYSLGGAVLAHLYRELANATLHKSPSIAGCIHLLHIWSWEHIHVGRPTLNIPYPIEMDGLSVGYRWNEECVQHVAVKNISTYRDELDGLLESHVIWLPYESHIRARIAKICLAGEEIWLARVPLISWKRVEWHLPDRVIRQFGYSPTIDVQPMDPNFVRVDTHGQARVNWMLKHHDYIVMWNNRRESIVVGVHGGEDMEHAVNCYMRWFKSWATLYKLKETSEPTTNYCPRVPSERHLYHFFLETESILKPFFGRDNDSDIQRAINRVEELTHVVHMHTNNIDTCYEDDQVEVNPVFTTTPTFVEPFGMGVGPSSYIYQDPSQNFFSYLEEQGMPSWFSPGPVQTSIQPTCQVDAKQSEINIEEQNDLRGKKVQPPQHYIPSTDMIPHRP